jgi:hypothetical protein
MGGAVKQSRDWIAEHLALILKWFTTPPKTIRHDSEVDRRALAGEIDNAVAGTRTDLAKLRLTETEEQKLARKKRRRRLNRMDKASPVTPVAWRHEA